MDIRHIANLSRIELSPEEEAGFGNDLGRILAFVKELEKIDTENVEPLAGGTFAENIMRPDAPVSEELEHEADALIAAAPVRKNGWIKVRNVFE